MVDEIKSPVPVSWKKAPGYRKETWFDGKRYWVRDGGLFPFRCVGVEVTLEEMKARKPKQRAWYPYQGAS